MTQTPVYGPCEDTLFLASFLPTHAHGRVIDVGTGSGILAINAARLQKVTHVTACDINPAALQMVQREIEKNPDVKDKFDVIESDMFLQLRAIQFDTILCNPPYLPDDPQHADVALDGGSGGHEWIARFLKAAREHLSPNGCILLLFSSFSNKHIIDITIRDYNYAVMELGCMHVGFFEQLYVYKLWRKN